MCNVEMSTGQVKRIGEVFLLPDFKLRLIIIITIMDIFECYFSREHKSFN